MEAMNNNALLAKEDLVTFTDDKAGIAAWMKKWYLKAGYKRLAFILMGKEIGKS